MNHRLDKLSAVDLRSAVKALGGNPKGMPKASLIAYLEPHLGDEKKLIKGFKTTARIRALVAVADRGSMPATGATRSDVAKAAAAIFAAQAPVKNSSKVAPFFWAVFFAVGLIVLAVLIGKLGGAIIGSVEASINQQPEALVSNLPSRDEPNTTTATCGVGECDDEVVTISLPHVCDGELFGDSLNNSAAQQLVAYLPEGYMAFLVSSDPGIVNGEGTNGSGYLALVESEELILVTSAGSPTGVGFNQPNQRWNVHVCAIPAGTDISNLFGDWQLGNIQSNGDRAGEQKPYGLHIDAEGVIETIWTSIAESRTYFKQ